MFSHIRKKVHGKIHSLQIVNVSRAVWEKNTGLMIAFLKSTELT